MDPGTFNMTLAWIEYINRLFGVTIGLLIVVVAIWAISRYRSHPRILIPALIAPILTAYQGWQGSQVVSSGLKPIIVSAHMVIALIIAGLMIYISIQAYYLSKTSTESEYAGGAGLHAGVLLGAALAQIVLGTQLREAIEITSSTFPLLSSAEVLMRSGVLTYIHASVGIIIFILALVTAHKLLSKSPSPLVWQTAWTMSGLAILQVVFGIVLFLGGIPPVARVLHMWISALLFGVILISYFALGRERRAA